MHGANFKVAEGHTEKLVGLDFVVLKSFTEVRYSERKLVYVGIRM